MQKKSPEVKDAPITAQEHDFLNLLNLTSSFSKTLAKISDDGINAVIGWVMNFRVWTPLKSIVTA